MAKVKKEVDVQALYDIIAAQEQTIKLLTETIVALRTSQYTYNYPIVSTPIKTTSYVQPFVPYVPSVPYSGDPVWPGGSSICGSLQGTNDTGGAQHAGAAQGAGCQANS